MCIRDSILDDPVSRSYYRFRDETGELFELSTLMMGHVASVEIQQITSVLAGHRDYVSVSFAAPTVPEIWVDNIRYVGSKQLLQKCRKFLEESAKDCSASLEIDEISHVYDFLGATWNHQQQTVQVSRKTLEKLPVSIPDTMSASDLEGLIGRLIFVAQLHQEPLVRHYWVLKWSRRFFNALNSGRLHHSSLVKIPPSAKFSLSKWLHDARRPHSIRFSNNNTKTATLFTDASLKGWGGVLVLWDGTLHLVGGSFSSADHNNNISKAEAMALDFSTRDLSQIISSLSRIDILVDNTSVEAAVRRGMPRAEELAPVVNNIWQRLIAMKVATTVDRVSTKTVSYTHLTLPTNREV